MAEITWTPSNNSEREAHRIFPQWELAPNIPETTIAAGRLKGVICRAIQPVGLKICRRWVPASNIKENTDAFS